MPKPPLPDQVHELLAKPNPSVITTVRPDGQPVSVATWYLWEDGRFLVKMDEGRKRLEYLRTDPRVTLTVLDDDTWYTRLSVQGRVVEMRDDAELADAERMWVASGVSITRTISSSMRDGRTVMVDTS